MQLIYSYLKSLNLFFHYLNHDNHHDHDRDRDRDRDRDHGDHGDHGYDHARESHCILQFFELERLSPKDWSMFFCNNLYFIASILIVIDFQAIVLVKHIFILC